MLGKVTFDEQVNILERSCKGDLSITFTNLNGSLSKIKGQVSHSVNWFRDYLSKRVQCTIVNGCTSSQKPVKLGVPQAITRKKIVLNSPAYRGYQLWMGYQRKYKKSNHHRYSGKE